MLAIIIINKLSSRGYFLLLYIIFPFHMISLGNESMECKGGRRTAAISKIELFVIIVDGFQPLTIITKCSILEIAAVLDPPLE